MSASEKLKALDETISPGPWIARHGRIGGSISGLPMDDIGGISHADADGLAALRSALPQIRAVVERLEQTDELLITLISWINTDIIGCVEVEAKGNEARTQNRASLAALEGAIS